MHQLCETTAGVSYSILGGPATPKFTSWNFYLGLLPLLLLNWARAVSQISYQERFDRFSYLNITNLPKFCYIFPKIAIYLSLGLLKGRPRYRRSLEPSKDHIQHFKTWNLLTFFYFCGSFLPSWIRIRIPGPDPDLLTCVNPDTIRIRSGFETLVFSKYAIVHLWCREHKCRTAPVLRSTRTCEENVCIFSLTV